MVLLEASPILENIYIIISIILALTTVCTTAYALYQRIKAKDWKGAKEELDKLLGEVSRTVDHIKRGTSNGAAGRGEVKKALKDQGVVLESLGLKEAMDKKLKELGLNDKA